MALTQVTKDVLNSSQANITQVGTLSNLTVTGNISADTFTGNVIADTVESTTITGTIQTASQSNITQVGTLANLIVTGNIDVSSNVKFAGWHIYETGTNLYFAYNGAVRMSLNTSGNLTVSGDIAGFGTP
jgi:hypothetical protein